MRRAADLMTRDLISVPPTMDLSTLARLFLHQGVTGAPVVDQDGLVVGMVTQSDLTRARASEDDLCDLLYSSAGRAADRLRDHEYGPYPGDDWGLEEGAPELVVADVMNREIFCIAEDASLAEVAREMLSLGVRRLLVTSDRGETLGLISSTDLVRALCGDIDELRQAVARLPARLEAAEEVELGLTA